MKNDFFKYILLSGGSRQNRTEIEQTELPITFKGNGHRLRNYRIYGSEGGVGDWQENGKYIVPVTVSGKNLYNQNNIGVRRNCTAKIDRDMIQMTATGSDAYVGEIENAGNKYRPLYGGCLVPVLPNETYSLSISNPVINKNFITFFDENMVSAGWRQSGTNAMITISENIRYITLRMGINSPTIGEEYDFTVQFEKGSSATEFESYCEPQTINIELDAPLMSDEYIDFRMQKCYPNGDIAELPALPTIDGTTILTVDTVVQPSKIYVQGGISEMKSVAAVRASTLQSLSLTLPETDTADMTKSETVLPEGGMEDGYTDT